MTPLATRVWAEFGRVPNSIRSGGFRDTEEVRTAGALHLHQIWSFWSHGRIRLNPVSRIGSFGAPARARTGATGGLYGLPRIGPLSAPTSRIGHPSQPS